MAIDMTSPSETWETMVDATFNSNIYPFTSEAAGTIAYSGAMSYASNGCLLLGSGIADASAGARVTLDPFFNKVRFDVVFQPVVAATTTNNLPALRFLMHSTGEFNPGRARTTAMGFGFDLATQFYESLSEYAEGPPEVFTWTRCGRNMNVVHVLDRLGWHHLRGQFDALEYDKFFRFGPSIPGNIPNHDYYESYEMNWSPGTGGFPDTEINPPDPYIKAVNGGDCGNLFRIMLFNRVAAQTCQMRIGKVKIEYGL